MTSRIIAVDPFDLVVFGATGDLAYRKLIPALFHRHRDGQIPDVSRIIGCSRRPMTDEAYRKATEDALKKFVPADEREPELVASFLERIFYVAVDATAEKSGWPDLVKVLKEGKDRVRAFYLAVSPDLFGVICEGIGAHGLITPQTRVIIEKPIGKSLESAMALSDTVGKVFKESQIYRIDHYLGKETVQNLMALRFANALFEPLWNAAHIDHVQITVAESVGVESRAGYYDTAGALRDMVQNHILQLLCLVAMEPPSQFEADAMRDEKLKVLRSLKPIVDGMAEQVTVRGQYRAGASAGGPVPGYLEELGRNDSHTETFVSIKAEIENWRWAGVPFYIRTGKRLPSRISEIVVSFKSIPHSIFGASAGSLASNQLVMRLQPDEGVRLWLMIKDPGPGGMRLRHVPLDMSFAQTFKTRSPEAYERLIMDVIRGNATLFMRRDEVEAAWRWIDPILDAWSTSREAPKSYTAGTWGPSAAIALIERDGRTWHEEMI
ncbi:glucose-6-phosphate dehydrogenase [Kaistia dalseonensis]|uniref:Glucose-6-phosphate 1-dehydrogenase n=1 Tax=Kaistia dalseonensis TaxID=410840 RepID=A0ABU0H876_9HYPH|nr:glucose-6-phosphate dehydrogenase [Kaistia dalseonensis]MCX5495912.1 glucose-6-phosphate dehydrogenase [Kaistia dalseonensis]MDQ0438515.1 glucose-6-phosphate 1-dehydrogenase [Kaistia dalseonensis]